MTLKELLLLIIATLLKNYFNNKLATCGFLWCNKPLVLNNLMDESVNRYIICLQQNIIMGYISPLSDIVYFHITLINVAS